MSVNDPSRPGERFALLAALSGLVVLYALWFRNDHDRIAAWIVFGLPPLLLALGVLARRATARFWAGVFALAWFSHGVMSAWAHPEVRVAGLVEVLLALMVVFTANAPGLRARFGKSRPGAP